MPEGTARTRGDEFYASIAERIEEWMASNGLVLAGAEALLGMGVDGEAAVETVLRVPAVRGFLLSIELVVEMARCDGHDVATVLRLGDAVDHRPALERFAPNLFQSLKQTDRVFEVDR